MSLDNTRNSGYEETLSALMDNEAGELELRRFLKDIPNNPTLLDTWKRFHVTRSVLHNEDMVTLSDAASSRILAAIADEPAWTATGSEESRAGARKASLGWMLTAGKLAVAASVALAVFVGLQSTLVDSGTDAAMADRSSENSDVAIAVASAAEPAIVEFDADAQRRLNDYIHGVSIQYSNDTAVPQFNILQDSQLIRQVNQIEN